MRENVSIALAAYNGERYIREQIDSIVKQMMDGDELVISINQSNDQTEVICKEYCENNKQVHLYICEEKGISANFENAILHCHNPYIFLSDQDDVWMDNKIDYVMHAFEKNTILVEHNTCVTDAKLNPISQSLFESRHPKKGYLRNLVYNGYQGSCLAFRKDLVEHICPIPRNVAMHDQWIGMVAEQCGNVVFLDKTLIYYRRYEGTNTDGRISASQKIKYIFEMIRETHRIRRQER